MRFLSRLSLAFLLVAGCGGDDDGDGDGELVETVDGRGTVVVSAVYADAPEGSGSEIELAVADGEGSQSQTVALGESVGFEVQAGEVTVSAEGWWNLPGGDTGGEGCDDCAGQQTVSVAADEEVPVEISLACDGCWID